MNIDEMEKENVALKNLIQIQDRSYKNIINNYRELTEAYMETILRKEHPNNQFQKSIKSTPTNKKLRKIPAGIYDYLKERGTPALIDELRQVMVQKGTGKWVDESSGNRAIFMSVSRSKNMVLVSDNDDIKFKKYGLKEWNNINVDEKTE